VTDQNKCTLHFTGEFSSAQGGLNFACTNKDNPLTFNQGLYFCCKGTFQSVPTLFNTTSVGSCTSVWAGNREEVRGLAALLVVLLQLKIYFFIISHFPSHTYTQPCALCNPHFCRVEVVFVVVLE
jgi:hypothetical protein